MSLFVPVPRLYSGGAMRFVAGVLCAAVLFLPVWADAQSRNGRFYGGVLTAIEIGSRGPISGGVVPVAGGLFGVQLTGGWAIEVEVDRGFRTTERTYESVFTSYAPLNSSRDEIERLGVRARFDRTQTAGPGFGVVALWRSREAGRLNAAFFGGVAMRSFESRTVRTPISAPPELHLPPDHPHLQREDTSRDIDGGGVTGGLMVLVAITPAVSVAPVLRYTFGLITDEPYRIFRAGVRTTWSF